MTKTTRIRLALCVYGVTLGAWGNASAQLGVDWIARYEVSGTAFDVALDSASQIYTTGRGLDTSTGFSHYTTMKLSAAGDSLWVKRYSGSGSINDGATALAIGHSGDVYVTGNAWNGGDDFVTIKYSSAGDTLWVRSYDGPGTSRDLPRALAVDDSGNVYVTGFSTGDGIWSDYATIKYSPSGDTLWVRRYNGPGNRIDVPKALAVDTSGNVYVTGSSEGNGTDNDFATIKYSPIGDTLWLTRYDGPANLEDNAQALAVDDSGNVYVTGSSVGIGTEKDYATIKYSPSGETLWVRRYNGVGDLWDSANNLILDTDGNVYVTGSSAAHSDYTTIKYSSTGDVIWVRVYDGLGGSTDWAEALVVDDSGNVYVTGYSNGLGTGRDWATIKYSPSGDTLWIRRYYTSGNQRDEAFTLAVDDSGNAYVAGTSTGSDSRLRYTAIKYGDPVGDVTCDGLVVQDDIALLRDYLDGIIDLSGSCGGQQADVDSDGDVDEDDYNTLYNTLDSDDDGLLDGDDNCPAVYNPDQAVTILITGDTNRDSVINASDIVYAVNYVFKGGLSPVPCEGAGDVDCNGVVTASDIIGLVVYVFKSGLAPCDVCQTYGLDWTCP